VYAVAASALLRVKLLPCRSASVAGAYPSDQRESYWLRDGCAVLKLNAKYAKSGCQCLARQRARLVFRQYVRHPDANRPASRDTSPRIVFCQLKDVADPKVPVLPPQLGLFLSFENGLKELRRRSQLMN
jgi:hypothetical protein